MSKRTRDGKLCVRNVEPSFAVQIKEENIDEEISVKLEPVDDYEIEPDLQQFTTTIILNGDDGSGRIFESEIGLGSQLEIVKSEVDVDEVTVNAFRDELKRMSIDAAFEPPKKRKRQRKEQSMTNTKATEGRSNKKKKKKKKKIVKQKGTTQNNDRKKETIKKFNEKSKKARSIEPLEIVKNGKKMVKCPFCDKTETTRDRSLLKCHIRLHTGEKPFKCVYCKERFVVYGALRSHIESHHKKKRLNCQLCRRVFYEADDMRSHELKCVKRRTYECHLCRLVFMNHSHMHLVKEHMRIHHTGEALFKCKYCPEMFVTSCRLSSHVLNVHPEALPFKCSKCDVRFADTQKHQKHEKHCLTRRRLECYACGYAYHSLTIDGLKMHMRKHTGEKPYQCKLCKKYYPRPEALDAHMQRHREILKLKCSKCHRRFMKENEKELHESKCKRRRYECHLCGFTEYGISFFSFRKHFFRHTNEKERPCRGCSKSFSSYQRLASHIFESHPHLIGNICPNCCYLFKSKNERDAHQLKCTKTRIECYICKHSSESAKTLRTHMTTKHSGAQRFKCKVCSRKYSLKCNLTIHMKSHTKKDLVKCQYCKRTFFDIKFKKKHEFKCKKVYECYLCKKTFRSFVDLHGAHMRTHLGKNPYDCGHCSRSIGSVRCYKLHVIDRHLHLYQFRCIPCSGLILKRKDFRTHQKSCMKPIRQSIGEIYFKCSLCGKGLARLPELRNHILNNECKNHPNPKLRTKSKH